MQEPQNSPPPVPEEQKQRKVKKAKKAKVAKASHKAEQVNKTMRKQSRSKVLLGEANKAKRIMVSLAGVGQ